MPTPTAARRFVEDVEQFIARHERARSAESFRGVGAVEFATDVLGAKLWLRQKQILESVEGNRLTRVISAHGCGKTFAAAACALWWLYGRGPSMVVTLSPTLRQTRELLWGELRSLFLRTESLPGELFVESLRVDAKERHYGIGFSGASAGKITGFHHPQLLVIADECHALDEWAFEALLALASDAGNKICLIGNPGQSRSGRWWEISQSPAWHPIDISCFDHPNITGLEGHVPGGPSLEYVEDMRREYGETSPIFESRVLGRWPRDSIHGLFRREWIDRAFDLHGSPAFRYRQDGAPWRLGLDVARQGADESVLAVRRGQAVERLERWRIADLVKLARTVIAEAGRLRGSVSLAVDATGLGEGCVDILRNEYIQRRRAGLSENTPTVLDFRGAERANRERKFGNRRAEVYWDVREAVMNARLALPRDERLAAELLGMEWALDSRERIQLAPKAELRNLLGHSPDLADAIALTFAGPGPRMSGVHRW